MKKLGKKGFLFKIIGFIIFIIAIILLVFLIKNNWDIGLAINEFIDFLAKLIDQISENKPS